VADDSLPIKRIPQFEREFRKLPDDIKNCVMRATRELLQNPTSLPDSFRDGILQNKAINKKYSGKVRKCRPFTNKYRLAYIRERGRMILLSVALRRDFYRGLEKK